MSSKNRIGPKITLDGEADFKKAIADVNNSLRLLRSEAKKNTREFALNKNELGFCTSQYSTLSRTMAEQRDKIRIIQAALETATQKFGANSEAVREWQIKLNYAKADLAETAKKVDDLGESWDKLEKEAGPKGVLEHMADGLNDVRDKIDKFKDKINIFGKLRDKLTEVKEKLSIFKRSTNEVGDSLEKAGKKSIKFGDLIKVNVISDVIVSGLKKVASACKSIAKGVVDFVKDSVSAFGELEQNLGGSEAVFGQYADSLVEKSREAYKNMGVAQSEYLATANKMGSLFQGSGLSQQRSLELTTKAMQRATDVASNMGIDTKIALDSIAGAAKGNFTMMDNLGVAMNATTLQAYAAGKGINFVWNKATNAEKAELAMQMFFEKTEQYAGNFAREAEETLTGSIGMVKSALQTLKENLGNSEADLAPMIVNLLNSVQAVIRNAAPIVQQVVNAILEQAPLLLTTGAQMVNTLLDGLVANLAPILSGAVDVVFTLVDGIVANLDPIMQAAVTLVVVLVEALANNLDKIINAAFTLVDSLVNALLQDDNLSKIINSAIKIVIELSAGLLANAPKLITAAAQLIGGLVKGLWDNRGLVVDAIKKVGRAMIDGLKNLFGIHSPSTVFAGIGKNLLEGLWNGIQNMRDWLIRKIRSLGSAVTDALKAVLGIHSPSTVFRDQIGKNMALGVGVGFETTMRDVAKRMTDSIPMDVDINATGNFTARRAQAAASGGNKVYNFNVTINAADSGGDVRALASRIAEEIYDEMRRKERAYA